MTTTFTHLPDAASQQQEFVNFLVRPESHGFMASEEVQIVETHISTVFLVADQVYKMKKPVRFDFLDFSTLSKRKRCCDAEVALNRRLAPNVYHGVVPLTRHADGRLSIGRQRGGDVVEWLVHMRRLDPQRTLEAYLLGDKPDFARQRLDEAIDYLAGFYANQLPVTVKTAPFRQQIRRHVEDNQTQLTATAWTKGMRSRVARIHAAQLRFLAIYQSKFDNRVLDGRIVDGHGDLRPDHIYLYDPPVVIDCIEFNREYRTNDVIDELAFLAMCCDRLGDRLFGLQLFAAYESLSGDRCELPLISFYKSYRATVRAKVASLQVAPPKLHSSSHAEETKELLELAEAHANELVPKCILLVGGLMGVGKSTLATALKEKLAAELIASDQVRSDHQPQDQLHSPAAYGKGRYDLDCRLANYRQLLQQVETVLPDNDFIILDATFSTTESRSMAAAIALKHNYRLVQIECVCPREVALQRITERLASQSTNSEARPDHFDAFAADAQPPLADFPLVQVDTRHQVADQCTQVMSALAQIFEGNRT